MFGLNPWVLLGFLGAFFGAAVGGYFYGAHVTNVSWQASIAKQKADAAKTLADATAHVLTLETANSELTAKLDKETADANVKAADADSHLRAALASVHGQQGRGCGGASPVRAVPATTGAASASSGGDGGLSAKIDDDHANCTRSANILAAYARACNSWAMSLPR